MFYMQEKIILFKTYLCFFIVALLSHNLLAQSKKSDLKKDKHWSYISGEQRAINDTNRVYYWCDPFPSGARVTNFNNMKLIDLNDTQFVKVHLNANQVYESSITVSGPSFFISKYEVTNQEYRAFVEDCIETWMKENRPEIAKKYKFESVEYLTAVASWLGYVDTTGISKTCISSWRELLTKPLNWNKIKYKEVSIFPKTEAWVKNFKLSYNEPMREYYFAHPAYNDYPVTCVSVKQAKVYCEWYTIKHRAISNSKVESEFVEYRLPTELEWERAASVVAEKPSKKSSGSPVNNNFLRNSKGNYIANFKPSNNNYAKDGAYYQTPVDSYFPNDAGCYNMQGNVAELTMTPMTAIFGERLEPNPQIQKYIVVIWNEFQSQKSFQGYIVKGGAWNLPEAACTIGSRTLIQDDEAKSYVGFRMVGVQIKRFRPLITPEF
jgi:formylglycine-generating enzyme required for sulfatase activity